MAGFMPVFGRCGTITWVWPFGYIEMARLGIVLLHYPVKGKNGETIASAITNLDIHDISRAAKTFGADSFTIVTPIPDQRALAEKIIGHWRSGA